MYMYSLESGSVELPGLSCAVCAHRWARGVWRSAQDLKNVRGLVETALGVTVVRPSTRTELTGRYTHGSVGWSTS